MATTVGYEWMIEASGCDADMLRSLERILKVCELVIAELDLCVVGAPMTHAFPSPGGVTAMYLLTESHLAVHTYPECEYATFNLYCCRERARWPWEERLFDALGATETRVRSFARGGQ